jgi:steroid delta-isomerase-like uncharacterized protein
MTREEIVAFFRRRHDAFKRRDLETLVTQHAPDGVHQSLMAGTVHGREAIREVYKVWFAGFPDFVFSSEELLIDGDRVAERATLTGTDSGGFMGLPPTGKPFRVPMMWLYTLKDHQFVHVRPIYDFTGLLVQIGVMKAKRAM